MKKRAILYAWSLILSLGFATVFQSVHEISHGIVSKSELCEHQYGASKHEITHQHHNYDHCKVCAFSFTQLAFFETTFVPKYSHTPVEKTAVSSFLDFESTKLRFRFLRGPPQLVA